MDPHRSEPPDFSLASAPAGSAAAGGSAAGWSLQRRVLPQHTDHAGVMWHGAYLGWLEEARVEALAAVGLAYRELSARGLELPVVSLAIDYRQALLHGDLVTVWSEVLPRQGVKLPWTSRFVRGDGQLAAEATVELVLVDLSQGPGQRRLLRRLPGDLEQAVQRLLAGPTPPGM
ncbi:MAG: acyl-CoA thioesterase [Synechococcaceae cyanobacterium]|nr:acyl-CoA thioesterase [Synechococcaceae cyanobacterium]